MADLSMQNSTPLSRPSGGLAGARPIAAVRAPRRLAWYFGSNAVFAITVVMGTILAGPKNTVSATYLILLFFLCSLPLLLADRPNGRYAIALVFMPIYFLMFGATDFVTIFPGFLRLNSESRNFFSINGTEMIVIVGAMMFLIGYSVVAGLLARSGTRFLIREWKFSAMLWVGLVIWTLGMIGDWFWQFEISDFNLKSQITVTSGTILTLFRMLHPVGILLLIFAYVVSKTRFMAVVVVAMLLIEFALGFAGDSKELSLRGLILLIMTKYFVDGRVPKGWLIAAFVIVAMTFSLAGAYRHEILHVRAQTRLNALEHFAENIKKTMQSGLLRGGRIQASIQDSLGRSNLKPIVRIILERVGKSVPYQEGQTIGLLAYAFVPRFILPDKPDSAIGRLFSREFKISESAATSISCSMLGELFWNFAWTGVFIGMFLIGAVMASVSALCNLSARSNATRLLIIVATIYLLCVRFEGGIALQFTVWARSVVIILIFHLLFSARHSGNRAVRARLTPVTG